MTQRFQAARSPRAGTATVSAPAGPPRRATLVASLISAPSAAELDRLPQGVDWLEVRADLCGELDPAELARVSGRRLLYTLRSGAEGGEAESSAGARRERLVAAGEAGWDLVDLEGERDLVPEVLAAVAPERRLVSWHGAPAPVARLERRLARLTKTPARLYKLVPGARQPGDALAPLALLAAVGRDDVVAFAGGPEGVWTRLVAPRLGAPVLYGAAGEHPAAPGQPAIAELIEDYGLPALRPVERLCGVVGRPVAGSLSPRLHDGAYRALGIPALYLPFEVRSFGDFWLEVVESEALPAFGLPLAGLSVTAPYKRSALAVAAASSPLAQAIGAANTLVCSEGVWEAEATDPEGVLEALAAHRIELAGVAAVVIGAGGAGRSAAMALKLAGARVTLANRTVERGRDAAARIDVDFVPLAELDPARYRIVVHATSASLPTRERKASGAVAGPPVAVERMAPDAVLVDLAYARQPTSLVAAARERGLTAIDGREVLLYQARPQFAMMTGRELPVDLGRRLLGLGD